jgi:hypothetical protein
MLGKATELVNVDEHRRRRLADNLSAMQKNHVDGVVDAQIKKLGHGMYAFAKGSKVHLVANEIAESPGDHTQNQYQSNNNETNSTQSSFESTKEPCAPVHHANCNHALNIHKLTITDRLKAIEVNGDMYAVHNPLTKLVRCAGRTQLAHLFQTQRRQQIDQGRLAHAW